MQKCRIFSAHRQTLTSQIFFSNLKEQFVLTPPWEPGPDVARLAASSLACWFSHSGILFSFSSCLMLLSTLRDCCFFTFCVASRCVSTRVSALSRLLVSCVLFVYFLFSLCNLVFFTTPVCVEHLFLVLLAHETRYDYNQTVWLDFCYDAQRFFAIFVS